MFLSRAEWRDGIRAGHMWTTRRQSPTTPSIKCRTSRTKVTGEDSRASGSNTNMGGNTFNTGGSDTSASL